MVLDNTRLDAGEESRRLCTHRDTPCFDDPTGEKAPAKVLACLETAYGRPVHPLVLETLHAAFSAGSKWPNVSSAARQLGCSRRELERRFIEARLPPPLLLVLGRWIILACVAARRSATTGELAANAGFSSTQLFCRAARREIRMSIPQLRKLQASDRLARDLITAYGI